MKPVSSNKTIVYSKGGKIRRDFDYSDAHKFAKQYPDKFKKTQRNKEKKAGSMSPSQQQKEPVSPVNIFRANSLRRQQSLSKKDKINNKSALSSRVSEDSNFKSRDPSPQATIEKSTLHELMTRESVEDRFSSFAGHQNEFKFYWRQLLGKPQVNPEDYDPMEKIDDALYNWEILTDGMFNNLPSYEHMC